VVVLNFTLGGGDTCIDCAATTLQTSTDGISWGGGNTAGCTSPRTLSAPAVTTYYRIITNCSGGTESTPSNVISLTPTPVYNWYQIQSCDDSSYLTTTSYLQNTFFTNDRVTYGGEDYTIVNTYSSNPGGANVSITATGQYGCPTATCRNYSYYAYAGCTIYWTDCSGNAQSAFVSSGQTYNISCAREGSTSGCGPFTPGAIC
jgi:hypothetical protein